MGKNRQHAERLFEALELELANESGKERAQISNKARAQLIAMARKKKKTIQAMIEEVKPALLTAARKAKEEQFPTLH